MTTIDRKQLITLLAERTGMAQSRVDRQLAELIDHIRQAEAGRDAFEIERFGRFSIAGDRLEFVPSDILSTEINNKYAGMKPIELMGAFKEPDGKDIPVADHPDEAPEALKQETRPDEQEEPVVVGSDSTEEPLTEPPPVDSPDGKPGEKPPAARQQEAQPREAPEASPPAPAVAADADESTSSASASLADDPLGKTVVILAIILTLAVAGWMAYD